MPRWRSQRDSAREVGAVGGERVRRQAALHPDGVEEAHDHRLDGVVAAAAAASVAARTDVEDFMAALMNLPCFPPRNAARRPRGSRAAWLVRQNADAVWFASGAVERDRLTDPYDH